MNDNDTRRVISTSTRKNIQEVVYHNVGPDGKKSSITRFEPLNPARNVYRRRFAGWITKERAQ